MIKVDIKKDQILIKGHAGYEEFGKDIVCASVTSIATTTINAIVRLDSEAIKFKADEGLIEIEILKHDNLIDILILNMVELLKELEKEYKKFIKINEEVHR
ncbi:MAG: ribosomal-processing cysteine protease Prp [Bacilli bacterium]|nr:ribosomal-processing cysteine protease Prp [Bacilli bacterium]